MEQVRIAVETNLGTVGEACGWAEIHRSQYYRWKKQVESYEAGDANALEPKSRRPKRFGREKSKEERDKVVRYARSGQFNSAKAIADRIKEDGDRIHVSTVIEILEEAGLYGKIKARGPDGRTKMKRGLLT